ncbi:hypothetical protein KRR39_07375 [Nocardioides panacis]|uniref:Uncharacterized protein n=1 Tax=Nocardioides panacis TaxID=2849501 RepID=A0A975T0W0_9ACTN|nr:hypothetical protein [Nocardioides panacis]QWZ09565.1 hypothetical protein KRR39_07375 [Nocardioides panacis]
MADTLLTRPTTVVEQMMPRQLRGRVPVIVLAVAGAALAVWGASTVNAPIASDYGLVAVLPARFWVGVAVLNVAVAIQLARPVVRRPDIVVTLGLLVVVLYGAAAIATGTPRTEVAWRHLGIMKALLGTGTVNPLIDGYFNWPGFFAGLGALLQVTHLPPVALALVAPVLNGLLWMLGVCLVVRALTPQPHHIWLAAWLFTLFNWIDQDYLSPQAFAYFSYLVATGLLLHTLAARPGTTLRSAVSEHGLREGWWTWWSSRTPVERDPRRRVAGLWVVVLLSVVILVSHQLTPFFLLGTVALLTVTGRCWTPRLLPVLGALIVIWLTTGASAYLGGHPVLFVQSAHEVTSATVQDRIRGTAGHLHVIDVRFAMTLGVMALAGLGVLRLWRAGHRDFRPVMLMIFPFLMVPLQSYGGEMLMRATLFALPFAAYYAAVPFLRTERRNGRVTRQQVSVVVLVVAALGSVGVIGARYGNAGFDTFTADEIAGTQALYRLATPGDVLVTPAHPTPWKYRGYLDHDYVVLTEQCGPSTSSDDCYQMVVDRAKESTGGALLMFTRATSEAMRIQGEQRDWSTDGLQSSVAHDPLARLVYKNRDVQIYRVPSTAEMGQ